MNMLGALRCGGHALLPALCAGALVMTPPQLKASERGRVEVQGHRGARARMPENTLPAFRYALEVGVDVLELDLAVTKDDVLVVVHDPVLNPKICVGRKGKPPRDFVIREHSLSELRTFDCGRKRNPRFPKQRRVPKTPVPTLAEVIALVKDSSAPAAAAVELNVEAKGVPGLAEQTPDPERFAALIVSALREGGMVERSILQSFDHRILRVAKGLEPGLRTSALVGKSHPDLVAVAKAARADMVSPNHLWITADDVGALHAAGVKVAAWTANSEAEWQRLLDLGVDAIITDDPEPLIRFLKSRPQRD